MADITKTLHESTKNDSLLSILDSPDQNDLLGEKLKRTSPLDFRSATGNAYAKLDELRSATVEKPTEEEAKEEEIDEEDDTPDEIEPIAAEDEEEKVPSYFHALNQEQENYRQRQDSLERELASERQQTRQHLEDIKRSLPRQNAEEYAQEYDFTDPAQARVYREQLKAEMREEMRRSQEPLFRQLATEKFQSTVGKLEGSLDNFKNYFSRPMLNQYFAQAAQRMSTEQLLGIDWEKELSMAHRAADYDRLSKELTTLKSGKLETKEAKKQEKQERKANLHLVPKATAKGTTAKPSIQDELDDWKKTTGSRRFGMEDVSEQLKKKIGI